MSKPLTLKLKNEAVRLMTALHAAVHDLEELYENNPELNDLQPPDMQQILPKSIDEWENDIFNCIESWSKLPIGKRDDAPLAKEFDKVYRTYNGWEFEYMYPGYFSYYKGHLRIFFTPDFNRDGELAMQLQTQDGNDYNPFEIEQVKYTDPIDIHQLFGAAKRLADRCDRSLTF